jgi:hypothetical protein
MNISIALLLFFIQIIGIYFISRITINNLFYLLKRIFNNDKIVFSLISLFFIPGTLFHEISHFFAATVLFLRVREIAILPKFHDHGIILGSVIYDKKDVIRSILVGLAPFFAGIAFFWCISLFQLFPNVNIWITLGIGYLIFSISSIMFSSKKDLQDIVYLIPIGIIVAGIIYIFQIDFRFVFSENLILFIEKFVTQINGYLFISIIIHAILIVVLKGLRFIDF